MKFVSFTASPYSTPSGTNHFIVGLDEDGELWWLDTGESLPGPRWHPLPTHPRIGTPERQPRPRQRK